MLRTRPPRVADLSGSEPLRVLARVVPRRLRGHRGRRPRAQPGGGLRRAPPRPAAQRLRVFRGDSQHACRHGRDPAGLARRVTRALLDLPAGQPAPRFEHRRPRPALPDRRACRRAGWTSRAAARGAPQAARLTMAAGAWPFLLYALTGFAGLLAEQGFEKYVTLLTGATASGAAVVILSYFLGFAAGSALAGTLLERGVIRRPLRTYGTLEFLVGVSCVGFAYGFHRALEVLAPLQGQLAAPVAKFLARFAFGSILVLPTATLMGASFPLVAHVVDRDDESGGRRWARAYAVNLAGAAAAALLGPYAILPTLGVRGSLWLCFATTAFVFAVTRSLRERPPATRTSAEASARGAVDTDAWLLLAASFASGAIFFVSEVLWTHLIGAVLGSSIYAFSSMLLMVLLGLLLVAWRVQRGITISPPFLLRCCALAVLVQFRSWDVAQLAFLVPVVPSGSFYVAESFKLLVAALLIVPSATMLGTIFPSLLGSPALKRPGRSWLLGLMNSVRSEEHTSELQSPDHL